MGNWSPIRDFEDEMMDMQPEYDMIYSKCEQRNNSSWYSDDRIYTNGESFNNNNNNLPIYDDRKDLKNEAKIRALSLKTNKIGKQYDENDPDSEYTKETEIISMIRNCGLESDINEHLDSKKTLPTVHSNKKYQMNGKSKFIVFLDESYFKLRPKNQLKSSDDDDKKICDRKNDKPKEEKNMKFNNNDKTDAAADIQSATFTISTSNSSSSTNRKQHKSKTDESSNLLKYYDKVKFYSPKEIYYKKKSNQLKESVETQSSSLLLSSTDSQRQNLISASSFETSS